MAAIQYSSLVNGMKGRLSGGVMSKNGGGWYTATLGAKLTKADAGRVAVVRANIAEVSQAWRALSAEDRLTWVTGRTSYTFYDKFGNPRTPSAYELYVSINAKLTKADAGFIDECPVQTEITNIASLAVASLYQDEIKLTVGAAPSLTEKMMIYASPGQSAGIGYRASRMRFIRYGVTEEVAPYTITSQYIAKYGVPAIGSTVWFMVQMLSIDTGQLGTQFVKSGVVIEA